MSAAHAPPSLAGHASVQLHVPVDWLDLVLDEEESLRRQVDETFSSEGRDLALQALLSWRARPGLLSYGLVEVHQNGLDATWHVLTSVVPVPRHPEVDPAAVLSRLLGSASPDAYVEVFDTGQGRAVGMLEELVPVLPDGASAASASGRATVLALPRDVGLGLLVVGVCVDPAQLPDLAALVTLIATRSTVGAAPA